MAQSVGRKGASTLKGGAALRAGANGELGIFKAAASTRAARRWTPAKRCCSSPPQASRAPGPSSARGATSPAPWAGRTSRRRRRARRWPSSAEPFLPEPYWDKRKRMLALIHHDGCSARRTGSWLTSGGPLSDCGPGRENGWARAKYQGFPWRSEWGPNLVLSWTKVGGANREII